MLKTLTETTAVATEGSSLTEMITVAVTEESAKTLTAVTVVIQDCL